MKRYLSELIGTFSVVFCGTGAIVINAATVGAVSHIGIAITFGLIVMSMIYAFGDKSGAHLNPAVTLAFTVAKLFPAKQVVPYIVSQLAGAIAASALLMMMFPESETLGVTVPAGSAIQSFILELILSFILMIVIISVANGSKEQGMFAGIAIGGVVALEAMFAGPISGASMNPARSFAPALVSGNMNQLWIYFVAPIGGTIAAVYMNNAIKSYS